jgi:hypothetical protein
LVPFRYVVAPWIAGHTFNDTINLVDIIRPRRQNMIPYVVAAKNKDTGPSYTATRVTTVVETAMAACKINATR